MARAARQRAKARGQGGSKWHTSVEKGGCVLIVVPVQNVRRCMHSFVATCTPHHCTPAPSLVPCPDPIAPTVARRGVVAFFRAIVAARGHGTNKKKATATSSHTFIVDFAAPADNKIFDAEAYKQFLTNSIKHEGKTGQLGDVISVQSAGAGKIAITSSVPMSKRYIKYLTKKFLKKNMRTLDFQGISFSLRTSLREWLRVVSTSPDTFTLKFFASEALNDGEEA
ncbi:BQ5605_C002g01439 [Microbotryum silenes-dioicae]|uniref:BQ5605_C002g01439 protein n=1 Tax=Microbotryum silenes-dioicae TaxID=796604 RepID=A0A2X0P1S9_9BASI|nr:BQ5605_C002g01439 [Microbotryum silenes-dioicae]